MALRWIAGAALLGICSAGHILAAEAPATLKVGSKRFTESYILGEILRQSAAPYTAVEHAQGLGNTAIVFEALKSGDIDVYPEYLGTIAQEILHHPQPVPLEQVQRELAALGLGVGVPLGFNNTYALAMRRTDSRARGIASMADLPSAPNLRYGLSHEFIGRTDGWPGLSQRYGIQTQVLGLDHGLAYEALAGKQVDVIDIYSTDAKIRQYDLQVLADPAGYFPRYDALLLYRLDIARRFGPAWTALRHLEGRISEADMIAMNAAAELEGQSFAAIAAGFLAPKSAPAVRSGLADKLFDSSLWRLTRQHLMLTLMAVLCATLVGVPLGVLAAKVTPLRHVVLAAVGVLQTVPSLALLSMLIPLLGTIGTVPALIALFLYALLPIVRNTCIGLQQIPDGLKLAAMALGLERRDRLLAIELPLALPVILAGIKTAAVMSVGTATIAAFIGAGGYGERIATGLALNDHDMLLAGAIPAAVLALLTQGLFELLEYLLQRHRRALA
jgi:osmoprotectant transport system permease protein